MAFASSNELIDSLMRDFIAPMENVQFPAFDATAFVNFNAYQAAAPVNAAQAAAINANQAAVRQAGLDRNAAAANARLAAEQARLAGVAVGRAGIPVEVARLNGLLAAEQANLAGAQAVVAAAGAAGVAPTDAERAAVGEAQREVNNIQVQLNRLGAQPALAAARAAAAAAPQPNVLPLPAAWGQMGGSVATVWPNVQMALAITGFPALAGIVRAIMNGPLVLSKKGFMIYNVPKWDELLQRMCSTNFAMAKGITVGPGNRNQIITSDVYKSMPASDFQLYKSLLPITPGQQRNMDAFDKLVDQIRDAMSQNPVGRGAAAFSPKNVINPPTYQTLTAFSKYPASVQSALVRVRTPTNSSVAQTMGQLAALRVVQSQLGGQRGGQRGGNPHAPLYPRMVMNGGAHPFATLHGGAAMQPAQVLIDKVKSLKDQFRAVTGQALAGPLSAQIDAYATQVNQQLKDVQDKLKILAGANSALAQYPLGAGVDLNMAESDLKGYAQHAKDLQALADKAMKKMDKLSEIKDLLQDLVDKQNPAPLNP
jgi:hypothetical protein